MFHWKARSYGMLFLVVSCPLLGPWIFFYISVCVCGSCWWKTWREVVQFDKSILEIDSIQVRNILGSRYQRVQWHVRNCLGQPIAVGLKVSESTSTKSFFCYTLMFFFGLGTFFGYFPFRKKEVRHEIRLYIYGPMVFRGGRLQFHLASFSARVAAHTQ